MAYSRSTAVPAQIEPALICFSKHVLCRGNPPAYQKSRPTVVFNGRSTNTNYPASTQMVSSTNLKAMPPKDFESMNET